MALWKIVMWLLNQQLLIILADSSLYSLVHFDMDGC